MSIPCCIRAQIPEDGNIRSNQAGHRSDITEIVSTEGGEIIAAEACPDHIHMLIIITAWTGGGIIRTSPTT